MCKAKAGFPGKHITARKFQRVIFGIQEMTRCDKGGLSIFRGVEKSRSFLSPKRRKRQVMKTDTTKKLLRHRDALIRIAVLLLCICSAKTEAQPSAAVPLIEITEVKNVGLSAINDSKSVIQALWSVHAQPGRNIKSFELNLEVTYADGAVEKLRATAPGSERKVRMEVPTLHVSAGRPGAELKSFKANITANFTETVSIQGRF